MSRYPQRVMPALHNKRVHICQIQDRVNKTTLKGELSMKKNTVLENTNTEKLLMDKLVVLKKNREQVPLHVLKTKYQKGYQQLCLELKGLAEAYINSIVCNNLRFRKDLSPEAEKLIRDAITDSGLLRECSSAVFLRQDFMELKSLAERLREVVLNALQPFYKRHICLYLRPECLEEPYPPPDIYNEATGYFYIDGRWAEMPETPGAILLSIHEKEKSK